MIFCQPSLMQKSNNHILTCGSLTRTCHACLCLKLTFLYLSVIPSHPRDQGHIFCGTLKLQRQSHFAYSSPHDTPPASPCLCWKFVAHPCIPSDVKVSYLKSEHAPLERLRKSLTLSKAISAQITNKSFYSCHISLSNTILLCSLRVGPTSQLTTDLINLHFNILKASSQCPLHVFSR